MGHTALDCMKSKQSWSKIWNDRIDCVLLHTMPYFKDFLQLQAISYWKIKPFELPQKVVQNIFDKIYVRGLLPIHWFEFFCILLSKLGMSVLKANCHNVCAPLNFLSSVLKDPIVKKKKTEANFFLSGHCVYYSNIVRISILNFSFYWNKTFFLSFRMVVYHRFN